MGQISLFAGPPITFFLTQGIGATQDDPGNLRAKAVFDLGQGLMASLVFRTIMQQGRNSLVLRGPVFQGQGADSHQVGYVGDLCSLAALLFMQAQGQQEGFLKPWS